MKPSERLFHMLLFEAIALVILSILAVVVTGGNAGKMTGLALLLSVIAMAWNYLFNWIFDRLFGDDRESRGLRLRIFHGTTFELGIVLLHFPVIMWVLEKGFWEVLMLDIGVVLFFFFYAIIYNWIYDILRARWKK